MAPATQWKVKGSEAEKVTGKAKNEERTGDDRGKGKGKSSGGRGKENRPREEEWAEDGPTGGKKGKGKGDRKGGKGKDGGRGGGGGGGGAGRGTAAVGAEGRSALSSSAPNFEPAGFYGGYGGYDEGAGGWGWPPRAPPLPLWREYSDADSTPYYYNSKTGLCQWDRPSEIGPAKPGAAAAAADRAADGVPAGGEKGGREGGPDGGDRGARDGDRGRRGGDGDRGRDGGGKGAGRKGDRDRGAAKGGGGEDADGRGRRRGERNKPDDDAKKKELSEFGPPGCNLFVFHLPDDWTDDDLNEYFAPHGPVISAKVMKELGTGRSRGFGFVSYEDRVSAATAIKKMQGYKILGKRLKVEFKKGEGDDNGAFDEEPGEDGEPGGAKKSFPDDERLIGYLRAISAKNVVQSLREAEGAGHEEPKSEGDEAADGAAPEPDDG